MKIVTWNINSVRLRLPLLIKLINEENPDIICLQETKTINDYFPAGDLQKFGYQHLAYAGEKSYNGVAIISRHPINNIFSTELYNQDRRHIAVQIHDFELHNYYVPAGGDIPDPEINLKFKHKLAYIDLMKNWFINNRSRQDKIILVGDLNIAPHIHDVWSSVQLRRVVSHTDIERKALIDLQQSFNFIDSARHFVDINEKLYTWWSYRNLNWRVSNRGRRLDHIWVSQNMAGNLSQVKSLKEARSWSGPSDHVPFILDLKP